MSYSPSPRRRARCEEYGGPPAPGFPGPATEDATGAVSQWPPRALGRGTFATPQTPPSAPQGGRGLGDPPLLWKDSCMEDFG